MTESVPRIFAEGTSDQDVRGKLRTLKASNPTVASHYQMMKMGLYNSEMEMLEHLVVALAENYQRCFDELLSNVQHRL